jgi:hypothetical protein
MRNSEQRQKGNPYLINGVIIKDLMTEAREYINWCRGLIRIR